MLAIDHLKSCKGGGGEVVNTCPINTWQWWLARAHPRGWAVRTIRLTLQMRQLAEVMGQNQSILLVLTLAAEGSKGQDGRAGTGSSRRLRGLRVQRAVHEGWGRSPPPPQHVGWKTLSGIATGIEKSSPTLAWWS